MPDANTAGIILIAVAVAAFALRIVAIRRPELRAWATVAMIVVFAILALVIGLFTWSVVGAYLGGIPD